MEALFSGCALWDMKSPISQTDGTQKKVLIVDPEDTITWSLSRGLFRNHPNFRVLVANGGKEALRLLKEERIDLVVCEVMLPDLHWLDLLEEMAQTSPQVRVIFMTYFYQELEWLARKRGAKGWVIKPFEIAKLRETIVRSLEVAAASSN